MKQIYLDDAATTKVFPEVIKAMEKASYGNPSSLHALGEEAIALLDNARKTLSKTINAKPYELYFTSGGTESNNWALFGLVKANKKKRILVSAIEHASILAPAEALAHQGYIIETLPVNKEGIIDITFLEKALKKKDVLCVSIMHGNNVIGTIQPLKEIGTLCKKYNTLFHTDACQTFGKLRIDVRKMHIDLLSASAHKIGGPKGVGFLYIREGIAIKPLLYGGGQEKGLRSGTENVPGIVGFAKALEQYQTKTKKEALLKQQASLMKELEQFGGTINGSKDQRLYNNIHVTFPNVDSDSLVIYLSEKGYYVSSGSACDSKKEAEDHVLKAIGINTKKTGSIRITLNNTLTNKDLQGFITTLKSILKLLQK